MILSSLPYPIEALPHVDTESNDCCPCRHRGETLLLTVTAPADRLFADHTQGHGISGARSAGALVAQSGAESPSVIVERFRDGQVTELLLTVGILANLTRGAMHRPGAGCLIDWGQALRQRQCAVRRLVVNPPTVARR